MRTDWTADRSRLFASQLLRLQHETLAALARTRFPTAGRGIVTLTWSGPPPTEGLTIEACRVGYMRPGRFAERMMALTGPARAAADDVLDQVARYDPGVEMVVVVAVGPQFYTLSDTVALDPPNAVPEVDGVVH